MLDLLGAQSVQQQVNLNKQRAQAKMEQGELNCPLCPGELKPVGKTHHCNRCGQEFEITTVDL